MAATDEERAFAALTEVGERLDAGDGAAAAAAARELDAILDARPADDAVRGYATMALDASLWLLASGREADALSLCETVLRRTDGGECSAATAADAAARAAAGARFLAAQAANRLGRAQESRVHVESLCAMGEPALAALSRLTGRLTALGADPAWHAQVAATSVAVLWRLGRPAEARALAAQASASFTRVGRPELAARLDALGSELGDAG